MNKETMTQVKIIFQKYGGKVEQSPLTKGTRYEMDVGIKEQPTGLSYGFDGLVHIVESRTKEGNQVFLISSTGTWLDLNRAEQYEKELTIAVNLLRDLAKIDPALVANGDRKQ
jgi:hypothetical protein